MSEIKYLDIEKIIPNPLNPRKDLGDLTELADSIKTKGILQNLTVVPDGENYVLVIGHRRHAASKMAGLTQLPCVIKELTEKEQAQIMLMENIQRNELNVYEQAQGFQMMIDLGSTVAEVAKETGFSKSTVRSRLKLNDLDQETLKEKAAMPISISDYIKLEQIKDPELKNEVLKQIGTSNFDYYVAIAVEKETRKKIWDETVEYLKSQATEIDKIFSGLKVDEYLYLYDMKEGFKYEFKNPDEEHWYQVMERGITVYVNDEDCQPETEEEKAKREAEERKNRLKEERLANLEEVKKTAYKLRRDFIKNVSDGKCKAVLPQIIATLAYATLAERDYPDSSDFGKMTGFKNPDNIPTWDSKYKDLMKKHLDAAVPGKEYYTLAVMTYTAIDSEYKKPYHWRSGEFTGEGELDMVYNFLTALGYEMSDEEKKFVDGTHELYEVNNEEKA